MLKRSHSNKPTTSALKLQEARPRSHEDNEKAAEAEDYFSTSFNKMRHVMMVCVCE
jgi:hypothetical protein